MTRKKIPNEIYRKSFIPLIIKQTMKNYKTLIYYFNIRSDTLKIVCFTLNIFITKNCGGLSPPNTTREKYIFTINKTKCFEDFEVGNVYFGTAIII